MATFLIIPAAGGGSRLARPEPKALVPLSGRPMLSWTLEAIAEVPFRQTVVAVPPDRMRDFEQLLEGRALVVAGGETRSASVRAGFYSLRWTAGDIVCIHDAARPFVTAAETARVIGEAERTGAAIAATPIVDTLKKVAEGRVLGTLDRTGLFAAGTPQAFRAELLADVFASGRESTDEAALFELAGLPVAAVPVSRFGFKITHPEDLEMAEALLKRRLSVD
jgi:2-C-methyl-D-erythritol 4-phosphate cytidylyltransferase